MTVNVQLVGIEGLIKQLESLEFSVKKNATEFLDDAGKIIEKNILKELKNPIKTGTINLQQRSKTSFRRSRIGESLAYDQGNLESLIDSSREKQNSVAVGFLKDSKGFDYAAYHEEKNNRPTLGKAFEASKNELESLLDKKSKV